MQLFPTFFLYYHLLYGLFFFCLEFAQSLPTSLVFCYYHLFMNFRSKITANRISPQYIYTELQYGYCHLYYTEEMGVYIVTRIISQLWWSGNKLPLLGGKNNISALWWSGYKSLYWCQKVKTDIYLPKTFLIVLKKAVMGKLSKSNCFFKLVYDSSI